MTVIAEQKLYELIKRAVAETLDEKLLKLKLAMLPQADDEEMAIIDELFESPEHYADDELIYVEDSIQEASPQKT